ncbi:hypothetical protein MKW98_025503 [Papaver atlanticum]|uniref:Uncharacterized protein n=1 Tax=Papaver atlanticum TaxID=357466 RepID=A0AAD4XCU4_9MAGN|nr:hypothetical protein MKW98_025503 [Papaver atlanticum]
MGICSSYESVSVATAKIIHQDGQLQEFSYPVRVSYVLQKHPSCFICNSDEMDFDNYVSALHGDEELQLGHLYFVLPLSRLKQPIQAEDLAALAVMASSALMKSSSTSNKKDSAPLVFSVTNQMKNMRVANSNTVGNGGGGGGDGRGVVVGNKHKRGSSRGRDFTSNLNVISE